MYIGKDMKELNKRDKDTIGFSYLWTMLVTSLRSIGYSRLFFRVFKNICDIKYKA